jgi:outer membrane protein assembly factor BamB
MRVTDRDDASEAAIAENGTTEGAIDGSDDTEPTIRTSRRALLRAGGVAGAGAMIQPARSAHREGATADQTGEETWPTYQYDAANTGHAPDSTGPVSNVGEKWRDSGGYDFHDTSAAVGDGTVYKLRRDGIAAFDTETGTEQWYREFNTHFTIGSPTVADGTVYVPTDEGGFYALDAGDGSEQFFFSTTEDDQIEENNALSAVVDGTIYVGGHEVSKTLYAVDAETGEEQWHLEVPVLINSTPAVSDGTVYVGSGPYLLAVDAETGEEQWRYETGGQLTPSPTVADGTVYVGGDFLHHAVDAASGEQLWTTRTDADEAPLVGQAVANGTVYAATSSGLYALDAETGEKQWNEQWRVEGGAGPPAVVGDTLYFVRGATRSDESGPQRLYALDAATGEELWTVTPETPQSRVRAAVAVANSTVYATLGGSNFYAIEGDAPEPATATPTATRTPSGETPAAEGGNGGGLPLVPIGAGALLAGFVGLLLVLVRRRDDEEDETGDGGRSR